MSNMVERYHQARQEVESLFAGLPYIHNTLISLLLSKANPSTGIVENINYQELCALLAVKPAPGRKESGIPSKSTLRSVLRTIESTFGQYFKIVSEGQQLILQFIALPRIYLKHDLIREENPDQNSELKSCKPQTESASSPDLKCEKIDDQCTDQFGQDTQDAVCVKNNINLNKQKTNITNTNSWVKQEISEHFYPSEDTIQKAQEQGLVKVTDPAEIQKFIAYNQKHQNRWEDFNDVFITWLEHGQKQAKKPTRSVKRKNYECSSQSNRYELTMQAVLEANRGARSPSEINASSKESISVHGAHSVVMGSNDSHIWTAVRE